MNGGRSVFCPACLGRLTRTRPVGPMDLTAWAHSLCGLYLPRHNPTDCHQEAGLLDL